MLLEPILELEVLVPDEYVGDILGDLSSRRGRVVGTDPVGTGKTLVRATAPEAEVVRYAIDLRSMTRVGVVRPPLLPLRGAPHMAAKVIEEANAASGHDRGVQDTVRLRFHPLAEVRCNHRLW